MISVLADSWTNVGPPNGIPSEIIGNSAAMLYQNRTWTSRGVPRKNQMYSQAAPDTIGFGDSRITAAITPSTIPITIDRNVR